MIFFFNLSIMYGSSLFTRWFSKKKKKKNLGDEFNVENVWYMKFLPKQPSFDPFTRVRVIASVTAKYKNLHNMAQKTFVLVFLNLCKYTKMP